jgi:hypothetical protein
MHLQNAIAQIQREFFFSNLKPPSFRLILNIWFVQGSHFNRLHFCGDLVHGYSTVCEEVDILV